METIEVLSEYEIERNKPMPSKNHSQAQTQLIFLFLSKYKGQFSFYTEINIKANREEYLVPDLAIYPYKRNDWEHDTITMENAPITAIEIASNSQKLQDFKDKIDTYFSIGVQSVWVLMPIFKTVFIFQADKNDKVYNKGKLIDPSNGIELSVEEIFD